MIPLANRSRIEPSHTILTDRHNCDSFHTATGAVHWVLSGKPGWDGEVAVVDLIGHPQAQRSSAATRVNEKRSQRHKVWPVLELPPEAAVQEFLREKPRTRINQSR